MDDGSAERAGTSGSATDEAAEFVPVARLEQLPEGTLLGVTTPDGTVECSWHGATFDPCSGEACRGPACDSVRTFPLVIRDGVVHVRV